MNTIEILDKKPFHKMHIGVGNLPSSYLDSLSYYEQLAFLTNYIVNTVIPKVNENITLTNSLVTEFAEVKELVDKAEKDVAVLTQQVLDLTAELARQIAEAKNYTDTEIDSLSAFLQNMISTRIGSLDSKLDREVARLDDKIEHYPISNVIVQNSIRGYETSIQVYLDDITNLLRRGGITASEYDALELTASEYDAKEITAYRYDFYGQLELTGSAEVDSIVLYNQTGQNTDGAMTQKAVTDALENAGGVTVVQTTGQSTEDVMSQKAVTDELYKIQKEIVISDSDLVNGVYTFTETENGYYKLIGNLNSNWNLKMGANGPTTQNAIWSNSYNNHTYLIKISDYSNTIKQFTVYLDHNLTNRVWIGQINRNTQYMAKKEFEFNSLPINNLTYTGNGTPGSSDNILIASLDARQGKVLKDLIDTLTERVTALENNG